MNTCSRIYHWDSRWSPHRTGCCLGALCNCLRCHKASVRPLRTDWCVTYCCRGYRTGCRDCSAHLLCTDCRHHMDCSNSLSRTGKQPSPTYMPQPRSKHLQYFSLLSPLFICSKCDVSIEFFRCPGTDTNVVRCTALDLTLSAIRISKCVKMPHEFQKTTSHHED